MNLPFAIDEKTNDIIWIAEAEKKARIKCLDCNERLVIKEGKKRIKHFSHLPSENSSCYFNNSKHISESKEHKYAKKLLADFLEIGGTIEVISTCSRCNDISSFCITCNKSDKVETEYSTKFNDKDIRIDIALIKNKQVKYSIEIKHTHATDSETRPGKCFEFDAKETILTLINSYNEDVIKLNNLLPFEYSEHKCLTLKEIAQELGYLQIIDESKMLHRKIAGSCKTDPHCMYLEEWFVKSFQKHFNSRAPAATDYNLPFRGQGNIELYKRFLKRKQCLRCTKSYETESHKPYCTKCYSHILNTKGESDGHAIPVDIKIRNAYRWLEKYKSSSCMQPCLICKNSENEKVFYYGTIQICIDCLDTFKQGCQSRLPARTNPKSKDVFFNDDD